MVSVLDGVGYIIVDNKVYIFKKGDYFILLNDVVKWDIDG